MDLMEARQGTGRRVKNTETGEIGRLIEAKPFGHWNGGVVKIRGEEQRVPLKLLEWTDGPLQTPYSHPAPHRDVLDAIRQCITEKRPKPESLFRLLFGRKPSRDEVRHMKGKLGGTCPMCRSTFEVDFEPDGTAQLTCFCPKSHPESNGHANGEG